MYIKVKRELCARLKDVMLRSSRRRFTSLGAGSLVRVGKKFIGSGVAGAREEWGKKCAAQNSHKSACWQVRDLPYLTMTSALGHITIKVFHFLFRNNGLTRCK